MKHATGILLINSSPHSILKRTEIHGNQLLLTRMRLFSFIGKLLIRLWRHQLLVLIHGSCWLIPGMFTFSFSASFSATRFRRSLLFFFTSYARSSVRVPERSAWSKSRPSRVSDGVACVTLRDIFLSADRIARVHIACVYPDFTLPVKSLSQVARRLQCSALRVS